MTVIKAYLASPQVFGQATITNLSADGMCVHLDETLFHPQGGGQPNDIGSIDGVPVVKVRHSVDGEVDHFLSTRAPFSIGDAVTIRVNEEARTVNTKYHSAGHLIADAIEDVIPGLKAVQGHHWPGEARVEFEGMLPSDVPDQGFIQRAVDKLIDSSALFQIVGDPYSARALKIGNHDAVGCGGTHVQSSSELNGLIIGKIKFKKGRLRVSYNLQ